MKVSAESLKALVMCADAMKVKELNIERKEEGWEVRILPPSNIEMMRLRIPAEAFEGYVSGDAFGVSSERLSKALAVCGDTVDIDVTDRMVVRGDNTKVSIPLYTAEDVRQWKQLDEFTAECVLSSDAVKRMSDASPEEAAGVVFSVGADGLRMSSEAEDGVSAAEMSVPADGCVLLDGEAECMFAWVCWRGVLKAVPRGTDVDIRLAHNYPVDVRFAVAGCEAEWMLAPWIVEE